MIAHLPSRDPKKTLFIWLGLGLTVALDTAIQILWKSAVSAAPPLSTPIQTIFFTIRQPFCQVIFALFIIQFINWMTVLSKTDLSYSQPVTSLSIVSVTALSFIILHEKTPPLRLAGMALILAGVWFISMTDHKTSPGTSPAMEEKHE
jgi:drug/metabolite transporter (DMT)-like permease